MDTIKTLSTYNTDVFNSWGMNHATKPITCTFEEVLKFAISEKAKLIVKPSRGKFWYIKGIKTTKTYTEIKNQLDINITSKYKENSKTWLLDYI